MIEQKTSEAMLEIAGPRGQDWRPASLYIYDYLRGATKAVQNGQYQEALRLADDEYQEHCEINGIDRNYNQARFRIRIVSETLIGLFSAEKLTEPPADR
ncbi:MAG: hypothetical protein M0Z50_01315 [Planctomycetia bacterium]|nr:hypothetical protein [Planctomycetia bacterium]